MGSVDSLFRTGIVQPDKWLHDVRELWREEQYKRIAINRPDFEGAQHGVNKDATTALLRSWESAVVHSNDPIAKEDLLQNAAVLRLLLTGGLMTPSLDSKHRKKGPTNCACAIGGEHTVIHVSWRCSYYDHLRQPIMHLFHLILQASHCFRLATVLTTRDQILQAHVEQIQKSIVAIWRAPIQDYVCGAAVQLSTVDSPAQAPPVQNIDSLGHSNTAVLENGHHIVAVPAGGVMCRKCGKHVAEPKHRRLKISNTPCAQSHLHHDFWTTTPGIKNNPHHHLDNFVAVCKIDSEHDLAWNLEISRAKGGKIRCLNCSTEFAWNNRRNITRQRRCTNAHAREKTPPKWVSYRVYQDEFSKAFQYARDVFDPNNAARVSFVRTEPPVPPVVRARLRTKTTVISPNHESASSSSSHTCVHTVRPVASSEGLPSGLFVHFDEARSSLFQYLWVLLFVVVFMVNNLFLQNLLRLLQRRPR